MLRTWEFLERDNPNKQFFNEDYWVLYTISQIGYSSNTYNWVFEVTPVDMAQ